MVCLGWVTAKLSAQVTQGFMQLNAVPESFGAAKLQFRKAAWGKGKAWVPESRVLASIPGLHPSPAAP